MSQIDRQAGLAVAGDEDVDKRSQRFGVLTQGPPAITSGSASVRSVLCREIPPRSSIVSKLENDISYCSVKPSTSKFASGVKVSRL